MDALAQEYEERAPRLTTAVGHHYQELTPGNPADTKPVSPSLPGWS